MILMIMPQVVKKVDDWLDEQVAQQYKDQPLAQDWARVAKLSEEVGEAISELILMTGQNPRKGEHPEARARLLGELADVAMAAILAIQHFTKDLPTTQAVLIASQKKAFARTQEQPDGTVRV